MKIGNVAAKVREYKPRVFYNYRFAETTDGNLHSIDRGAASDRYETEFVFKGKRTEISEIVEELDRIRVAGIAVELSEFEEHFFGENVNHSGVISAVVSKISIEEGTTRNVYNLTVSFLATDLSFEGETVLPTSVRCISAKWRGGGVWNSSVSETYNRNNYFFDSEKDRYQFSASAILNREDLKKYMNFRRNQRGTAFPITDGFFGVSNMFGAVAGGGVHVVVFDDSKDAFEFERISAIYFRVSIDLVKVG